MATSNVQTTVLLDPSQIYRPESCFDDYNEFVSRTNKTDADFRNYEKNLQTSRVRETYMEMHTCQTLDFVNAKKAKWGKLDKCKMSIMDAVFLLDNIVDSSDPDTDLPNSVHAFQTAERIRADHPDKKWFQLVGLLHDLGKVLAVWGEPQYCVVGDTFPLGCKFSDSIVFPETFKFNPDSQNPQYSSQYGIYEPGCGLDNVTMSWGHDEYMYLVLKGNGCPIPDEGMYMVRYHSFYPWHSSNAYDHLCSDHDREMLKWIKEFSKYDLYSKSDEVPDVKALRPYYESLIATFCPGELRW